MKYIKPQIISYSQIQLEETIIAFASCGATYCAIGVSWGSTCGSGSAYCPNNASYSPGTGFCPSGSSYVLCPSGSSYTGPYNEKDNI